jgi:nucleotide-binding universal stress UspA family protein
MTILVCVDVTPLARWVVQEAGALAKATGAALRLVHVVRVRPTRKRTEALTAPDDMEEREAFVEKLVERAKSHDLDARGAVKLCTEPVHEYLLAQASRMRASIIVIGSHNRGRMYETFTGSTTQGVIKGAVRPVLVVPNRRSIAGVG